MRFKNREIGKIKEEMGKNVQKTSRKGKREKINKNK